MKKLKQIVAPLATVLLMGTTNAQAQWATAGNSLSGGEKLGSTNNQPVDLYTNNVKRGTITGSDGFFGIGTNGTTPQNRLLVEKGTIGSPYTGLNIDGNSISPSVLGIFSVAKDSNSANIPVFGYVLGGTGNSPNLAVVGKAIGGGNNTSFNYGIFGEAIANNTGTFNAGVRALANNNGLALTKNNGGEFDARGGGSSSTNQGISGTAEGDNATLNIGVDAHAFGDFTTNYGINSTADGNSSVNYAGYFNGDIFYSAALVPSDTKLKENIRNYGNALEKIEQLNVKQYVFKQKEYPYMVLPEGEQVGLLSPELKKVFPNLVKKTIALKSDPEKHTNELGVEFEAVNYTALIPVLIQGVKELNQKVSTLEERNVELGQKNQELEKQLNELCASGCGAFTPNGSPVNTTGQNQLFQNVPNPFGQTTEIAYSLDASVKEAYIAVVDMKGIILKRFDGLKGNGKVMLSIDGLTEGVYNYSLFANGKLIDTKKMAVAGNR